jgi:hypothetical protein
VFFGQNFAEMQTKKIAVTLPSKLFILEWYFHPIEFFFKKVLLILAYTNIDKCQTNKATLKPPITKRL